MSNVRKKDRPEHRLTVLDACLNLYDHTTNVIANEKVFDRTYKGLIDRIDNEASMIYHLCRSANEDFDNRKADEAAIRLGLQKKAVEQCLWLKTDIRLAQRKFHLRAKKTVFWNGLVNNAMQMIKAWHAAEKKAAKERHGL